MTDWRSTTAVPSAFIVNLKVIRTRVTAVLLALIVPLVIALQMLMSLGSALIPMLLDVQRPAPSAVGAAL